MTTVIHRPQTTSNFRQNANNPKNSSSTKMPVAACHQPTQFQLKQAAYNSNIKSRALSVLIYLIDRTNKELTCFPSLATIGKNLHISLSTVKRAIKELVESGFLTKEARFSEKKNGGQTSNMYYIAIPEEKEEVEETTDESVVVAEKVEVTHISFETIKAESKDLEQKECEIKIEQKVTNDSNRAKNKITEQQKTVKKNEKLSIITSKNAIIQKDKNKKLVMLNIKKSFSHFLAKKLNRNMINDVKKC